MGFNRIGTEARCNKCGESFVLTGEEDTQIVDGEMQFEHYSDDCGGFGPEVGSWGTMTVDDLVDREDDEPLPDADESGNLTYPFDDQGNYVVTEDSRYNDWD